ncbi:hypothetical protein Tco_1327146 [Tanacetum coccineum]
MAEYSQKWHNGTSSKARSTETFDGLASLQAQLHNLEGEIKKVNEKVYAAQHRFIMDNPNITMEEYIRLQEEKALSRDETFDWQTATYGKMKYCEDEDDCFTNFESKFPAIVLDDTLTSSEALSWKPTVSPLTNNEIDFKISFDESDDEDYMDAIRPARDFPPLIASVAPVSSSPALVLDDSCVVERDLSCHVMGRVKDIKLHS